ncbi:MAG: MerR family transcriptional regulator [Crocinitomicaceae bacterium]|nr:MerR family transcriptional regulator [Crocinitomicaceae bacterium]
MEQGKLYYSIGELAKMFDVNTSLIRFWEKEFGSLHKHKNAKGNRKFTSKDIEHFKRIYELVKVKGYTLEGAKKELKGGNTETLVSSNEKVIEKLNEIKEKLHKLRR